MSTKFTEEDVHQHLYKQGLETLIVDAPGIDDVAEPLADDAEVSHADDGEETEFRLWQVIKARALEKLTGLHRTIRYSEFIGSKIKLPTDKTTPMELDLLGQHEDGLFILELKVDRAAERNAFSELFAYSNYIAGLFTPSGHKDITNVLVARLENKITRQAFLYDLLIADRNIIVYTPDFPDGSIESMRLHLHIPTDDDFLSFTNQLLSHDAMSCVVASFNDLEDWFDSKEEDGILRDYTKKHLEALSNYTAQLMESEHLHGFCFIRKPWQEVPRFYRNSLFICAINPFRAAGMDGTNVISEQLEERFRTTFFEIPDAGFYGRLTAIAKRAIKDCLTHDYDCELELPLWSAIVVSPVEVAITHNFGFRPTGLLREAYVSRLNSSYAREAAGGYAEDLSILKINEINNWLRAWMFMEGCGFAG
ncbi:hypothetical protein [Bradyrhizobium sp. SZCCHNS2002]|uniref:hypothetical protein n=1 Tax=Bradyrhizobium sp. SZCCHNS2002 TaxID=3057302 RepID=UPI0029170E31|nr:hypothetical protein [Bradyrhizobium sp. SZCCHNS2002]